MKIINTVWHTIQGFAYMMNTSTFQDILSIKGTFVAFLFWFGVICLVLAYLIPYIRLNLTSYYPEAKTFTTTKTTFKTVRGNK